MVQADPVPGTLKDRLEGFLRDSHPSREDSRALDNLSSLEIHEVTFSPLREVRDTSLANFLVPLDLSARKRTQAWRYAPHMRLVIPLLSDPGAVDVQLEFSVPRWVTYAEWTQHGPRERKSPTRESIPPTFFDIESAEGPGPKRANLRGSNGGSLRPRGFSLGHYRWEARVNASVPTDVTIEIPEFHELLKEEREPQSAAQGATTTRRPGTAVLNVRSPARRIRVSTRTSSSASTSTPTLEVEIANVTPVSDAEATSPSRWGEKTIVFPVVRLLFQNPIRFPSQDDVRRLAEAESGDARRTFLVDIQEKAPRGVNCIVTIPERPEVAIIAAMTAIHDNVLVRPKRGPPINELADAKSVSSRLECFSAEEIERLASGGQLALLAGVMETIRRAFPEVTHLHRFQWLAIQRHARLLLTERIAGSCHLVKAPTGTGKTLVFMANALLYYLWTGQRTALAFPTRILNEDMYRRLTILIFHARQVFPTQDVTGGILIGTRDPLYNAIARPEPGQRMVQFEVCPKCQTRQSVVAQRVGGRVVGICQNTNCKHSIDYMFGSGESADFLPAILIATPDKLFYEATARSGAEYPGMRLFGGRVRPCKECGAFSPVWWNYAVQCIKCNSENLGEETRRPILFWTFDEVHSLHGLTGIYLSIFLALLQLYERRATSASDPPGRPRKRFAFQVGTATIANEAELLTELTRLDDPERQLIISPTAGEFHENFALDPDSTRYRNLVTMPIATSAPRLAARAMVHVRDAILRSSSFQKRLENDLGYRGAARPYRVNLTYVQRKDVGRLLVREYREQTSKLSGSGDYVPFVSGDTPNEKLVDYFTRASKGTLQNFVANVVISLGLDIENLNQLVMVSLPESITEYIQTIGRTGRRDKAPGHIHVIVRPDLPRDLEFFESYHYILSDLRGYFDSRPMRHANQYAARQIFANVLRIVLFAHSERDDNYMMTAPKAIQKLEANPPLKVQVLKDLTEVLYGIEGRNYQDYLNLAFEELSQVVVSWSALGGPGNYIGGILSADQLLLLSLRDTEDRDIPVRALDALAGQLQQTHHERTIVDDESSEDPDDGGAPS